MKDWPEASRDEVKSTFSTRFRRRESASPNPSRDDSEKNRVARAFRRSRTVEASYSLFESDVGRDDRLPDATSEIPPLRALAAEFDAVR